MPKVMRVGKYKHRHKPRTRFPIVIVLFLLISLGSFTAAVLQGKSVVDSGLSDSEAVPAGAENVISDIELTDSSAASQEASSAQSSSQPTVFGTPLPESERVDNTYFSDAVFFGDSVTDGISLYSVMSNAKVIAYTGINPATALTREVIKSGGDKKISMIDALKNANPSKIYIMMGINAIGMEKEAFISSYEKMLDAIIAQHPNAIIYIQPITPVTSAYEQSKENTYGITNVKINSYNADLLALAGKKKVYYVDVSEALKDENGALPSEASPKDGIHFGKKYYEKWFEYLRTHTAAKK
ncbi:GDSL-type esterase/lipase family protein [Acetanaerobacterium elongatum]|uniref:Lysophospholipase L1 n=1 Tax=Acetanaerobacterium elongatum TaxID=258515 RepID=A0A1H0B385_9FIRM|nr:GDSL-type esterase/lipase family protein [Acetanaerobacterium elongatum]SDN40035.1 Lysophospholipase L1 [Acetanaerobacterium elongatum]